MIIGREKTRTTHVFRRSTAADDEMNRCLTETEPAENNPGFEDEAFSFWHEEDGVGVVEIILILVVLISLVIIFKNQLTSLVSDILAKITSQSNSI